MRNARAAALAALLLCAAAVLSFVSSPLVDPHRLPLHIGWSGLAVVYLVTGLLPVEFPGTSGNRVFTFTHLALALGLVFVDPTQHLLVRVAVTLVLYTVIRRRAPAKVVVNVGSNALEVGVATAVASGIGAIFHAPLLGPGPPLWCALIAALLVSDAVACVTMQAVLVALRVTAGMSGLRSALATSAQSTALFSGVGVVVVAGLWADAWSAAAGAAVAGTLVIASRKHLRLTNDQIQTAELHQFLKGLGPLDLEGSASDGVLEQVRGLLRAEQLDLAVHINGTWEHHASGDAVAALDAPQDAAFAVSARGGAHVGDDDWMSAPLMGALEPIGVLRVQSGARLSRTLPMRDLRLLETVATELAKAIERGRLQRQVAVAATTDALTGLPNLPETTRLLDELLHNSPEGVLVAALAVDSFREINDTLGHQVGDELLSEVTRRLLLPYPGSLVGRIGGGRFAVAVSADLAGGDPSMFGLGLRAQVEGGAQLGPVGTHIKLSVGCTRGPEHGAEAATLIRRAETAMYSARNANGGPVIWEPAYEVEGQRRLAVVMALREAVASGAIGIGFQPKVDTLTRVVTGVEALARWTHPALGAISPAEFVPLAEASGLMGPLTSTVLRQALTACKGWQRRGGRIGVAVNVSAETILDPSFVTEVAAILTSINISPDLLTLELTEGVVVNDPLLAAVRMTELRQLGVKISVDDFGTGYSSLTYLKGLPVDEVKIDKAFVDGIVHDLADGAVVRAVVDIAHTLGLKVVAEGVEQEEQHRMLARFGVDEVQGYLHARPMAPLDMSQWLRRRDQEQHSFGL